MLTDTDTEIETESSTESSNGDELFEYRSVHTGAVLGLLIGCLGSVILFTAGTSIESTVMLTPAPLLGLLVSLYALMAIRSSPEVYTGARLAVTGAVLSLVFLVGGLGYGSLVYATEVPDGYVRTSFSEMKPSKNDLVDRKLIPDAVSELLSSSEKVFIKGYIRPDSVPFRKNISNFLLVRDNNQCCFGDLSSVKYFDQVQVRLAPGLTTDFSRGVFRLGGEMTILPGDPQVGTPLTYFLDADYVDP